MRQCKVYVHGVEAGILQETEAKEYLVRLLKAQLLALV